MRLFKPFPALLAVAALLALAPAGASAARAHASSGNCTISLAAEPRTITSGESSTLFGQLLCLSGTTENKPVTIYGRAGTGPFKVITTVNTVAGGFYMSIQSAITENMTFYTKGLGARSANRGVRVAPVVKLAGPPEGTQLKTGPANKVTFTGSVTPADTGAQVFLQREASSSAEEWHSIGRGVVLPGGVISLVHIFRFPGEDVNVRLLVRPFGPFAVRGVSNVVSYGISQAQNPNLTIKTSKDPVGYSTPITISGVLAGGEGKTVTLIGKTASGSGVIGAPVIAGAGGAYSFVVTPLVNTAYRVTGPNATGKTISSAFLYEGVRYLLTAGVSSGKVQSGQSLTFAGTVTPGHLGKIVYLERENLFGGGFHVVEVAAVTAGSTYTLTDFIFGSGKANFRVKVPGDPSNSSVSSPTFPIEITPAPPSALKPVAQPKLPSEGQH